MSGPPHSSSLPHEPAPICPKRRLEFCTQPRADRPRAAFELTQSRRPRWAQRARGLASQRFEVDGGALCAPPRSKRGKRNRRGAARSGCRADAQGDSTSEPAGGDGTFNQGDSISEAKRGFAHGDTKSVPGRRDVGLGRGDSKSEPGEREVAGAQGDSISGLAPRDVGSAQGDSMSEPDDFEAGAQSRSNPGGGNAAAVALPKSSPGWGNAAAVLPKSGPGKRGAGRGAGRGARGGACGARAASPGGGRRKGASGAAKSRLMTIGRTRCTGGGGTSTTMPLLPAVVTFLLRIEPARSQPFCLPDLDRRSHTQQAQPFAPHSAGPGWCDSRPRTQGPPLVTDKPRVAPPMVNCASC
jgi:hypothetical protein